MVDHLQAHLLQGRIKLAPVGKSKGADHLLEIPCPSLASFEVEVAPPPEVDEEEVEDAVAQWFLGQAEATPRAPGDVVKDGDEVTVSMVAYAGGRVVPGTARQQLPLTREMSEGMPGLYDGLVGKKVGASEVIDVEYPPDFPLEELQNIKLVYAVDILVAVERLLPDADEALSKAGIDSDEALRAQLKMHLMHQRQLEWLEGVKREVLQQWVEAAKIQVPKSMIDAEIGRYWEMAEGAQLKALETPIEQQTESRNRWLASEDYRQEAADNIRVQAGLGALSKAEEVDATLDAVNERLRMAAQAVQASAVELETADDATKQGVAGMIMMEKAAHIVLEHASVVLVSEDGSKASFDLLTAMKGGQLPSVPATAKREPSDGV